MTVRQSSSARVGGPAQRSKRRFAAALLASGLLLSASAHAASTETRTVEPGAFDSMETSLPADFVVRIGGSPQVRFTAEPGVLERLEARVEGRKLVVEATASFETRERVLVEIQTPGLAALRITGSATVELESLRAGMLQVHAADSASLALRGLDLGRLVLEILDSAQVQAEGRSDDQRVAVSGSGRFDGGALAGEQGDVEVAGAGEARLDINRTLRATVTDAGSVVYAGRPDITRRVSGAGSLESGQP